MLGMRKNNPHQVFVLLDALNDYFKQPQFIEEAASKLFKGDGAAGNKIKEEIESIDTSGMADKALAKLIDSMKEVLIQNYMFNSASNQEIKLEKRESIDLMQEYKKNFEWKNTGDNKAEISYDPDACLIKIPVDGVDKAIVVSSGPDSYDAE